MSNWRATLFAFYFLYRITDTTTGALVDQGEKSYPDLNECENRQRAWHLWVTTPRINPATKKPLPPDSVVMTNCEPGRLDKMPR
jgi:hypothetical protein